MAQPTPTLSSLSTIEKLYDAHRYLEAFQLSAGYWNKSTDLNALSIEELIAGCRLAARLGGTRISRWLIRKALERDPTNPRARYYSQLIRQRGQKLFDRVRADPGDPELRSGDAELDASWLATQALTWAALRDFETAHVCISRAHAIYPGNAWILSCESGVLGLEDRWEEAWTVAESSWKIDPGSPYGAAVLVLLIQTRMCQQAPALQPRAQRVGDGQGTGKDPEIIRGQESGMETRTWDSLYFRFLHGCCDRRLHSKSRVRGVMAISRKLSVSLIERLRTQAVPKQQQG